MTTDSLFTQVRYYTQFDPYFFSVDNRPLQDLAYNDEVLATAIDNINVNIYSQFANTSDPLLGDNLVGSKLVAAGATARTQHGKNAESVSVFDFMSAAEIADVQARTTLVDVVTAINTAIQFAITKGLNLRFPYGTYKISSPIMVYVPGTFITIKIVGESVSTRTDKGVIIDHTSILTTPGMIIHGGRSISIEEIEFLGPNICFPTSTYSPSIFTVAGVRDSRYSPQCAIAIDPFSTSVSPDGGYPGMTAFYAATALLSSRTVIKRCTFFNQVVGIFSGITLGNNENNVYDDLHFQVVKTAISFGQLQSKGCVLRSIFCLFVYTVVDTYTYSDRNGSAGFAWYGGDLTGCNAMVRTLNQVGANNSVTHGFTIDGVYAEGQWTIGWVGDSTNFSSYPGQFSNCNIWFTQSDTQRLDANFVSFGPVKFDSCTFWNSSVAASQVGNALKFYNKSPSGQKSYLIFDNCRFMSKSLPLFDTTNNTVSPMSDVIMRNCTNHSSTGTSTFRATFGEHLRVAFLNDITNSTPIWPGSLIDVLDVTMPSLIHVKQGLNSVSLGTIAVTVTGFNATFTAPDSTTLQVGDIIYATNQTLKKIDDTASLTATTWPLGVVASMVGAAITLSDVGPNAVSSSMALSLQWYPHMHGASTVVTNSTTAIAITAAGNQSPWAIGDRVIASDIPAGAYIVSGTSPNWVISKAATATAGSHRVYDADCTTITQVAL